MVSAACASGASMASAAARMPVGVPAPVNASSAAGSAGFDGGAQVFAFSMDVSPGEATRAYAATLSVAGYVAVGSEGAWRYFRSDTALIAYEVGRTGPPTDLVVRVMARDAPVPQDADVVFGDPTASDPSPTPGSTHGPDGNGSIGGAGHAAKTPVPQPDPPHGNPGNGNAGGNGNGNAGGNGNGNGKPAGSPTPGNGNGNGNAGGNGNGNGKPTASPTPIATPAPTPTPTPGNGNAGGNGNGNAGGNGNGNAGGNGNGNAGGNGNGNGNGGGTSTPNPGGHGH